MEGDQCYRFRAIQQYIKESGAEPIRVALDIGAGERVGWPHICGEVSKLMTRVFPQVKVYGFESNRRAFRFTKQNCRPNKRIHLYNLAVEEVSGERLVRGMHTKEIKGEPTGMTVRSVSLSDALKMVEDDSGRFPDLVKFDCEGCERRALRGITAEDFNKVRYFVGEYHGDVARLYKILENKGVLEDYRFNFRIDHEDLGCFFLERKKDSSVLREQTVKRNGLRIHKFRKLADAST